MMLVAVYRHGEVQLSRESNGLQPNDEHTADRRIYFKKKQGSHHRHELNLPSNSTNKVDSLITIGLIKLIPNKPTASRYTVDSELGQTGSRKNCVALCFP